MAPARRGKFFYKKGLDRILLKQAFARVAEDHRFSCEYLTRVFLFLVTCKNQFGPIYAKLHLQKTVQCLFAVSFKIRSNYEALNKPAFWKLKQFQNCVFW